MSDKITTLKLIDNTDVFPNIKDENIPDTIMRIADLSKYLNQLKSINITGDIDSTTTTSDIATFTTADISTLNVSGVSQFEGDATFGHNVHVVGNLFVNGIDNIVDKNGNKINNMGTFDPTSDNPAGQKSIMEVIGRQICLNGINIAMIRKELKGDNTVDFSHVFDSAPAIVADLLFPLFDNSTWKWDDQFFSVNFAFMFSHASITHFDFYDQFALWIARPFSAKFMFGYCTYLQEVGAYDFTHCSSMVGIFEQCWSLRKIHLKNIPISFAIYNSSNIAHDDLVEILNNLMDLTGKQSQTLSMGAINLAKLTDSEKAIATNKNWVLA